MPIFPARTANMAPAQRSCAAWQAVAVALAVITVLAVFGQVILDYLGITLPALQAAGGLLLLLLALELLTGRAEEPERAHGVNVAMVPLGTPLLAGPGAIVATMLFAQQADEPSESLAVGLAIVAGHLCLWASMHYSVVILRVLKDSGITLVTRIAGLLLSAIAVQLVADAVRAFVETG